MGYYDELDKEIDQEMGWRGGKKGGAGSGGVGGDGKKSILPRRGPDYWQALLRTAKATSNPIWWMASRFARALAKVAFYPLISPLGYSKRFNLQGDMMIVKRSFLWRLGDGILTRALLTPLILAAFLLVLVYAGTHPRTVQAIATPDSFGIYFKRVSLITVDNQRLTAWYIPPYGANEVAKDPEGTLLQKWPGVVLCHGLGASHDQYLPLARQLHELGFAVLMVDLRGQGESDPAAVTYGLRERMDVLAGVKFLREMPAVDMTKVCVVGHDIGATAALQATALDSSITAVVADGLWPKFEDRARDIFSHTTAQPGAAQGGKLPTEWLAPLYTVTFEIAVRDRLSQLDPEAMIRGIHTQPVLFIARTGAEYVSVQDVLTLATNVGGRHEVYINNANVPGDAVARTAQFLVKVTGWKGPKLHGSEEIQELLKNQVPAGK
jgi:pimeloyl-ACP methyl ester carboxylesterase